MTSSVSGANIQFGEVYQSSENKSKLFRKHNGFSPDSVIKAIKQGQEIKEGQIQKKIDFYEKEQLALLEADKHIKDLLDAAKALSNPRTAKFFGDPDCFGARNAVLSSSSLGVDPSQVVRVVSSIGAAEASTSIRVDRVATKDVITSSIAQESKVGSITENETVIYIKGCPVYIPANATLEEIAGAINGKTAEINVTAYARKFGSTDYRLYIGATTDGEKITLSTILDQLGEVFDSDDSALGLSGTVVVGDEEVVITADMMLGQVAAALSALTNISATVAGGGPYTLDIMQNSTPTTLSAIGTEKLFNQLGLSESVSTADALKAKFYVDGAVEPILSATNHVEGLLHKTTIHLLGGSGGETITANVQRDKAAVQNGISAFISAYNSLVQFTTQQTERDSGNNYEPKEGAYLAKNRQFVSLVDKIRGVVSRFTPGVSGINHISEVGIVRDENGFMVLNEGKFEDALENNFLDIERVFASVVTNVTGGYFSVIATPLEISSTIADNDVHVALTKNASGEYAARLYLNNGAEVLEEVSVETGSSDITISMEGYITLSGPLGSVYEGLTFFYGGPDMATPVGSNITTETQTLKITQGFSDVLATRLGRAVYTDVKSDKEADHVNDLDRFTFRVKKQRTRYQDKLKEMQKKHADKIKKEEAKAERFQLEMEKVTSLEASLKSISASLFST